MGYYPNLLHILSYVFIFGGFIILAGSWRVLYEAQKTGTIAITGLYKYHQASPISRTYYYNAMLPAPMANVYNVR